MVDYYIDNISLFNKIASYLKIKDKEKIKSARKILKSKLPHDVPDSSFRGPF